jgi:outer membrane protein TolC
MLWGVLAFLVDSPATAQDARLLTLDECVRLGLERNATLRVAEAGADEAQAAYRQVRAARRPALTAQGSYSRLSDNIPSITFTQPGTDIEVTLAPVVLDRYYTEIGIEQPLFTGMRLHHQIQASARQAESVAHDVGREEVDVAFRIRQAYWTLFEALSLQQALAASRARVDASLADVRNRRDAGAALESDVLTAQTRRSEVLLEQVQVENAVRVARLELNRLVGLALDDVVEPVAPVADSADAGALDALLARVSARHPLIDALAAQAQASSARVRAAQGGWFPEVLLNGRYAYARPNQFFFLDQDAFRGNWEAGVALRWNLWDGGRREGAIGEARARRQAAEARLADARDGLTVAVTRQYLEVERARASVQVLTQNVREAEEAYRVVSRQYEEGAALTSTLLEVEEALRRAQARYAQASAAYEVARAALTHALGSVW